MVIDHGLVSLALFIAAEEQAAVRPIVVFHFPAHFEVTKQLIGQHQTAVTRDVLAARDGSIDHFPFAAGLVLAGARVTSLSADMPALEGSTVVKPGHLGGGGWTSGGFGGIGPQ